MSGWNDMPSFEEVGDTLKSKASLSAEIRVLELRIQILEAEITQERPRNTAVRIMGYDQETSQSIRQLRAELADKRGQLDEVESKVKFLDYWKDMFKAVSYRERL
jgi:hypothetical protein